MLFHFLKHRIIKKVINKRTINSLLTIAGLIALISMLSYNISDPSWNTASSNLPYNILSYLGSYTSDFLLQILGLTAFIWIISAIIIINLKSFTNSLLLKWLNILRFISIFLLLSIILENVFLADHFINLPSGTSGLLGKILNNFLDDIFQKSYNISTEKYLYYKISISIILILILSADWSLKLAIIVKKISKPKILIAIKWIVKYFYLKLHPINLSNESSNSSKSQNAAAEAILERFFTNKPSSNIISEENSQEKDFTEQQAKFHETPIDIKNDRYQTNSNHANIHKSVNDGFHMPRSDLLSKTENKNIKIQTLEELNLKSTELLQVLNEFGVKGQIIDIHQGPVVTLYEFQPAPGIKSARVIGLADDVARSLSAVSTRIAAIPGRNVLGIELPNDQRSFFNLKELLESSEYTSKEIILPIILGKDLSGKPYVVDLTKMPHLLVAGTTGSGKSVGINSMIISILYRYNPEECKFIMIDPKMLELSVYDNIPHLLTPVVTEPGKAIIALKWAVKEMENRYRLMSTLGVRNILGYNERIDSAQKSDQKLQRHVQVGFDKETGEAQYETLQLESKRLPYIVIIVDEMADLMLLAGKDIEASIQRLAQMARAAGIHLIMATQRPSVDVITGVIKANFPSRVSFKVTSKIDSRTILGQMGAEQLLGMGDMLYLGTNSKITRVHGPFVHDREVEIIANHLKSQGKPEYLTAVVEENTEMVSNEETIYENNIDDNSLYRQALNIVKTERKSSTSYIQRVLRIGYNRAAILVERMEKEGILSEPNHSGKRTILLPEE